ncbi:MAG: hypothetical protein ABI556_16850 [Gemmatimonadales bacterium]
MPGMVKRVVLVGIDGLEPGTIERFSLFNFRRIIERGASAVIAPSVNSESTAGGVISLLTGMSSVRGEAEGASCSFIQRASRRFEPLAKSICNEGFQVSGFLGDVPAAAQAVTKSLAWHLGFHNLSFKGATSAEVVSASLNVLCTQRRGLIGIHLLDLARAKRSEDSDDYGHAAQRIDQSLGILPSLSGATSGDSLLVIVAAQPVATGTETGQSRLVLFGRSVESGTCDNVSILDVAPTIMWALGLAIPGNYEGRPLTEAFGAPAVSARAFA